MLSGADQLKDWMERRYPLSLRKAREAADYFGFDESFVSMLVRGTRRPGLENAVHIERLSGIPVEAWVSSELDQTPSLVAAGADNPQSDKA